MKDKHHTMSIIEATNIGNQLLAMGLVTHEQLRVAQARHEELKASGDKTMFGTIMVKMGIISEVDLERALQKQREDRSALLPVCNQSETEDALKILRQTAAAHKTSTSTQLAAIRKKMTKEDDEPTNPFHRLIAV